MAGVVIVAAMLAAPPVPSKVLTVKVDPNWPYKASIVIGGAAPSGSQLFSDEQEVLASISTANKS